MKFRNLSKDDFKIGLRLEDDVVDDDGVLILAKGTVLTSKSIELFTHEHGTPAPKPPPPEPETPKITVEPVEDNETPFDVIDKILQQLDGLYKTGDIRAQKNLVRRVLAICDLIRDVCLENEDLALGSILLEQKARYTVRHPLRAALVSHIVSRQLGWATDDQASLVCAALTMNVGMLSLQEKLNDQDAPLSQWQKDEVRKHPAAGVELLKESGVTDKLWLKAVLQHHEALNGSGYPSGLKGDEIIEGARILSLADAYCARVSGRNYRPPLLPSVAVKKLFLSNTNPVDKDLALVFVKNLGVFPPGTFVKLLNGETAIVTQRGEKINNPIVCALVKANGARILSPIRRDTATSADFSIKEVITSKKAGVEINKFQLWGYGIFKRAKTKMRKTDRLMAEIPAKLLDMENLSTADCVLINISENGCLLKTLVKNNRELIVNRDYHLTLRILDKTLENIAATVRNSQIRDDVQMVGMQFIDISPDQQKHITLYLKKEAEKSKES
jgi:HD-GYP domain-containing protein (c-di-GMP phosphodiesterase class II)